MYDDYRNNPTHKNNSRVLFNAVLRPNRSLSPRGFKILMAMIATAMFVCGTGFFIAGAWPVIGFLGLDIALVYIAFRLSYRSGGGYETVFLTADELTVTKVNHLGQKQHTLFQPYWLRISLDDSPEGENQLIISSHGQSVSIGQFLAPDERGELAQALECALNNVRSVT